MAGVESSEQVAYGSGPPKPKPKVTSYDSDSEEEMTDAMLAIYSKEVKESAGFNVSEFPRVCPMFHQIIPMDLSRNYNADLCEMYSKLAIEKYNEKLKEIEGELEFVEVLKGMSKASRGIMYYLTFSAKNLAKGGRTYTYQAVVLEGLFDEIEVISFRAKPGQKGVTKKKWFWQGHIC